MNLFDLAATLKLNTREFENGIKSAQMSAAVFAKEMTKGQINVGKSLTNIGQGMQSVGQKISKFGQGVTKVGKAASVVTAGLGVVLGAAFNKAKSFIGTYESAMTVFTRKLGGGKEAASKLYDSLVKVAKGSSFAQEHMISAGQTLVAMGLDADKTTKYVQAATDAIAGMGGSGAEVEEMATLFAKISQQTNLYTQDIQQMVERGIPAWDILATKYHTTTDAVKDMARKGLLPASESLDTITGALEESDEASEMFKYSMNGLAAELKSGTLTGTLDSLNTSFREFSLRLLDLDPRTESGQENIKKLNKAISEFGKTLEKIGEKFGKIVGQDISNALDNVTRFLENFNTALDNMPEEQAAAIVHAIEAIAIAGPALIIVGTAITWVGNAISGIGSALEFLGSSGLIDGLVSGFTAFAGAVGGVGVACGIVAAVIGALIAVFIVVKENWDKVVAAFSDWYEKSGLKENIENLKQKFSELGEKLGGLHDLFVIWGTYLSAILLPVVIIIQGAISGLVTFFDGLITVVGGIIDILAGFGEVLMGLFTGDWDKVKEGFQKIFEGLMETLFGSFEMIYGTIGSFLSSIWEAISSWFTNLGIGEWLSGIWNGITEWCSNVWNGLISWLTGIWDGFVGWISGLWNGLINWLLNIWNSIVSWCVNVWNTVREKWNQIKESIMQPIMNAYNQVRNWVERIKSVVVEKFNSVKSKVMEIWDNVKNTIYDKIKWAQDKVHEIIEKIKGFFNFNIQWPHIPMPHFSVSPDGWQIGDLLQGSIPSLHIDWYAKGGIFTQPTLFPTSSGLAGVGEAGAEAVLPIKLLKDYVREAMAEGVREAQISYKDSATSKANAGMVNALLASLNANGQEINVYIGGKQIASEIYDPLMDIMKKKEVRVGA